MSNRMYSENEGRGIKMEAKKYLELVIDICDTYESDCDKCPLCRLSCGQAGELEEISELIETVERYEKQKEKEIKPCPFCGQPAEIKETIAFKNNGEDWKTHTSGPAYYIGCTGCGAETKKYDKEDQTRKAWNERRGG